MTAQLMEINGCKLHVVQEGPENPPLTIIAHHGAPGLGSHQSPLRAFRPLTDKYGLVCFDARGSGRSEDVPPFSHEQWTADIEALRDELDLGRIVMAGGSYGGYITVEYALRYPDSIRGLIFRGTGATRTGDERTLKNAEEADRDIDLERLKRVLDGECRSNEEMKECWRDILPLYTVEETSEEEVNERSKEIDFHYQTHNWAFSKNIVDWDLRHRLDEIEVPALIVHGVEDWIVDVERAEELHAGIADSELHLFENCGHSPQHEDNERFVRLAREFLKRTS